MSKKTERLSYKGGCGIREHMCIKTFKEELAWAIDKRLRIISNKMLFKTVIPLKTKKSRFKFETTLYALLSNP